MKSDQRSQVLAMVATLLAATLAVSLWMQWATVGFEASAGMLSEFTTDVSGWKVHDFLDIVIAIVAVMAASANLSVAAGNARVMNGAISLFCGIVAGAAVAWTMIEPPVPELLEAFNSIPGVPDIQFDPAIGLFVALGAAIGLILVGILQMGGSGEAEPAVETARPVAQPPGAPAPPTAPRPGAQAPPPDPFAKTPPPPPDPFAKTPPPPPPPTPPPAG